MEGKRGERDRTCFEIHLDSRASEMPLKDGSEDTGRRSRSLSW